jgi:hypothetical protein
LHNIPLSGEGRVYRPMSLGGEKIEKGRREKGGNVLKKEEKER